ncbi:MAG: hypothetical protein IJG63_07500, partial [Oscillospiraceae bacterium]|nr:hypothetical protein [Oscillospiraceae bacterium]
GDWNDGLSDVGAGGRGESLWLSCFGAIVLDRMALLCEKLGKTDWPELFRARADELRNAVKGAFCEGWFLRGYYDDGTPLGKKGDAECEIDSVAQSFALFSLGADDMTVKAVMNARESLFDREKCIIKLLDPPFNGAGGNHPGYIRAYHPGFRENGGQYTHAAVWLAMALFDCAEPDEGYEMLRTILPATHDESSYKAEPYVLAGDVYSDPLNPGRGGWSWYTGASGWYFRAVTEKLLGIRFADGRLVIKPALPTNWNGYGAHLRLMGKDLDIAVKKTAKGYDVRVNGRDCPEKGIIIF